MSGEQATGQRIWIWLGPIFAVLGAASWIFRPDVAGADLFWHLASGREIWEHGAIPSSDPFSFTFAGREWMNHEWLWDVLYWVAYSMHREVAAWLNVAVLVSIFSVIFVVARRTCGLVVAAGAALWLAAAAAYWFLDIRPHLFTLLLVSVVLLTRDRPWAPWLWPILMVGWVNLHAGFVYGLGVIGLLVLVRTIEASVSARRLVLPRTEWIGLGLCLLAWLANPWGWKIVEYPLAYLESESPYRTLLEWQPPPLGLNPRNFETRFWAAVVLAALGAVSLIRRDRYLVALAVPTVAMAITSRRFIPLFLVVATPLVAEAFAVAQRRLLAWWPALRTPAVVSFAGGGMFVLVLFLWKDARPFPDLFARWTSEGDYPRAAVRYLGALGPPQRVLNHYNWGGFLMLHEPGTHHFIDGRANTLYDEEIYLDYLHLNWGRPGVEEKIARYRPDAALLPPGKIASSLVRLDPPWRMVYRDTMAMILVPPDSALLETPLPQVDEVLKDDYEKLLIEGFAARSRRDYDAAARVQAEAVERAPLVIRAYGALAATLAMRGEVEDVAAAIAIGIGRAPRFRGRLRDMEGRAFLAGGKPERALPALREAIPTGPFGRRERTRDLIDKVERQLADR